MIKSGYYMATIPDKCRVVLTSRQQMVEVVFASPFPHVPPDIAGFQFHAIQNRKKKKNQNRAID